MADQRRRNSGGPSESPPPAGDPDDITRVFEFRVPCRTCHRGIISIFERGREHDVGARGRHVVCPVCRGKGFVF